MNPCELTMGITALANAIAANLSDEDLGVIAGAYAQLGDTLGTILAQRARCKAISERNANTGTSNEMCQTED